MQMVMKELAGVTSALSKGSDGMPRSALARV